MRQTLADEGNSTKMILKVSICYVKSFMQEFCGISLRVVYRWWELYGGNFLEAITQVGIFPEVLWFGVIEPFSIFAL